MRRVTSARVQLALGGRPRFRGGAPEVSPVVGAVFLFLLPLGRPRPLFTGASVAAGGRMSALLG
jgi:hypothetical protein